MSEVKLPEGYKQTEIGVIPKDWEVVSLGDIGNCVTGLTYSPNDVSEFGTLVLRSSNVQNGQLAYKDNVYVDMSLPERVVVKEGDILICVRNGSRRLIGKCALIDENSEGNAFGAFMSVFRTKLYPFIFYQFQSNLIQNQIQENMGATINQITNKDLKSFKVMLPKNTQEQTAIATALSDIDNLIGSLEKLIAKKEVIKTGTMQQLLTGKTRLPEFATRDDGSPKRFKQTELGKIPEDWAIKPIAKIVKDSRIPSGLYKDKNSYATGAGTSIIKLGDVFSNNIFDPKSVQRVNVGKSEIERYKVEIGDLIIALASVKLEGVGKVMHVTTLEEETIYDHNVALIRPINNVSSSFLSYIFHSNYFRSLVASKATQVGTTFLKASTILGFELHLPSTEEQTAIATILSDMDAEIQALQERLGKTKDIKQGMMQQLLTGKVRLAH